MNDIPVRKNTGSYIGGRDKLNLIEGSNVTLTVADDAANGEVDITIAASGGGAITVNASATTGVNLNDALPAAPAGDLNVKWQLNTATTPDNVSAYVDVSALEPLLSLGNLGAAEDVLAWLGRCRGRF